MKKSWKIILSAMLAAAGFCGFAEISAMPVQGAEIGKNRVEITREFAVDEEFPESEELFAGYAEGILYEDLHEEAAAYANVGEWRLKGAEKTMYQQLKSIAKQVASGKRTDTVAPMSLEFDWTAKDLGVSKITEYNCAELADAQFDKVADIGRVLDFVLMDCPYELYWFDKTEGFSIQYVIYYDDASMFITEMYAVLPVAEEYQKNGELYTFDNGVVSSVEVAKNRAAAIVNENADKTRYEKLIAYKEAICELTDYNYDAAEYEWIPYGNPWQLIWIFDGDPSTNVVCEGYSKAFQYLCDLSNLECYTVYGTMTNGISGGPHMWNLVRFNNKNYLVDVTNCDDETDLLFMAGTDLGSVAEGYLFDDYYDMYYIYETGLSDLLGESILKLSATDFDPAAFENAFEDVFSYDWYYAYVEYVYEKNLMSGYREAFSPNQTLSKAQVAQVLYNMEGKPEVTDRSACTELVDVYEDWFTDAVCWAYEEGIITGDLYTKEFQPNADVTREQLALMLYRYAAYKEYDVSVRADLNGLKNAWKLNTYAEEAVQWAVGASLIGGIEIKGADGSIAEWDLAPQGTATRGQMAAILTRFCENLYW